MSYKLQNSPAATSTPVTTKSSNKYTTNLGGDKQQQQFIYLKRQSSLINQLLQQQQQQQRPSTHNPVITSNNCGNKDTFCSYPHRFCLQERIEDSNYCIKHILFDKNAPYKQCSYIHPQTNKRCQKAARRYDRRDRDTAFCTWHIQQFNLLRRKNMIIENYQNTMSKDKKTNLKRKFEELEHYCPTNEHDHRRKNCDWELNDFKSVIPSKSLKAHINDSINIINYQNQNQNDTNNNLQQLTLADVTNFDSLDSDNESVDGYMEDPLRHAGIYSAEETSHILRDKMLRLQTLYINLLGYYRQMLKQKMRQYYLAKISMANNNKQAENSSTEPSSAVTSNFNNTIFDAFYDDEDYKIMKAMHKYHNISGPEKLIQNKASEIREKLIANDDLSCNNYNNKQEKSLTCIYKKDSQQCQNQCIPLSNYCRTHILYDPYQILFRPCANGDAAAPCLKPIISYVHRNTCIQHTQIKFDKDEIMKIMKSPEKIEPECLPEDHLITNNKNNEDDDLTNENELFNPIDDISMAIDPVESENLFSLEHDFDDIDTNLLS